MISSETPRFDQDTKAQFEKLADNLIQATLTPCKTAVKDAGLSTSDIDEVILVGGSTRIPAIQDVVKILCMDFLL